MICEGKDMGFGCLKCKKEADKTRCLIRVNVVFISLLCFRYSFLGGHLYFC